MDALQYGEGRVRFLNEWTHGVLGIDRGCLA